MIEEQALVVEVEHGELLLEAQTRSSCGGCNARAGCGTSVLASVVGRKFTHFRAENTVDAKPGDFVMVGIPERSLLTGSLMIYLLPIVVMILFAIVGEQVYPSTDHDSSLTFGLTGLLAGLAGSRWYFKSASNTAKYTPVILRKLIDHGKLQR
jgi:sigma-E factor negative regulatory protein RseC